MSRVTQQMRDFAQRLIALETQRINAARTEAAAFHVCERLRPHLAPLMGSTGFHALLSRALALASREIPRLRLVHVNTQGSLACVDGTAAPLDPGELAEGGIVLTAQLLGLLEAFIGESLTLRILREAWPKLPAGTNFKN